MDRGFFDFYYILDSFVSFIFFFDGFYSYFFFIYICVLNVIVLVFGFRVILLYFSTWVSFFRVIFEGIFREALFFCFFRSMWIFLYMIFVVCKELSEGFFLNISYSFRVGKLFWVAGKGEGFVGKWMILLDVLCLVSYLVVFR